MCTFVRYRYKTPPIALVSDIKVSSLTSGMHNSLLLTLPFSIERTCKMDYTDSHVGSNISLQLRV
jgi:hypothetical protein